MRSIFIILFLIGSGCFAQSGFEFKKSKQKVTIPFQFINDLVFISLNVNGVDLTFLLDSGVSETLLFSLDNDDEILFTQAEAISLRGLGTHGATDGYRTINNIVEVGGDLVDRQHEILVVLNDDFNFSSTVGIPVHGIIGYHFFKKHFIEINYISKKISIYNDTKLINRKIKKHNVLDIIIENNKPYAFFEIQIKDTLGRHKMLIDTGNSNALWIFDQSFILTENTIDDYLGRGFSGSIYGKRTRVSSLFFGNYKLDNVLTAFPDSSSIRNIQKVKDRNGSIGSELLKRFSIFIDYKNAKIYYKPNKNIHEPFVYNMSGIEVSHQGMQWVTEISNFQAKFINQNQVVKTSINERNLMERTLNYDFVLKPVFVVSNVRKDSPAYQSGIREGDEIIAINGKKVYKYNLNQINLLMKKEEGTNIKIEIKRDNQVINTAFILKKIL